VFAGKKSAQIREILISESAWEEMTCLFAPSLGEHQLRRYICPKCEHESTDPMRCTAGHAPGVNQYPESCDATIWNSPDSWDSINPIIKLIIKSTFLADLTVHTIFYPKGLKLPEIQDVE
jgi:hypothetical protein